VHDGAGDVGRGDAELRHLVGRSQIRTSSAAPEDGRIGHARERLQNVAAVIVMKFDR